VDVAEESTLEVVLKAEAEKIIETIVETALEKIEMLFAD
jgi:hypothetical protein